MTTDGEAEMSQDKSGEFVASLIFKLNTRPALVGEDVRVKEYQYAAYTQSDIPRPFLDVRPDVVKEWQK